MTLFEHSSRASGELPKVLPNKINRILKEIAEEIVGHSAAIIKANEQDIAAIPANDIRRTSLKLDIEKIERMAQDVVDIAALQSPVGKILSSTKHANEMIINKVTVPYGVIGIVYEAEPRFAVEGFALCLKSGNSVILSCDEHAQNTSETIVRIIKEVLRDNGIASGAITLLKGQLTELLTAVDMVDLIIPRGSRELVKFVCDHARVPVISTLRGVCHTYIDKDADTTKAATIVDNAKTRSTTACNSLDCMIIHHSQLPNLAEICLPLQAKNVILYADTVSYEALDGEYQHLEKVRDEDFNTEFLDYKMAVKCVKNLDEALNHIATYSSKHSEAIVTENSETAKCFIAQVDAACVYHNVSTAFTDGIEFGMGTEIGISTQKLGTRGPISLPELTTYKYIITGDLQTR